MRVLRSVGWLFAAALLLGVAGASAPVFVSATGTRLLHDELRKYGDDLTAVWVATSGPAPTPEAGRAADAALQAELDDRGLPPADRTVVARGITVLVDGTPRRANLVARDGLLDHLPDTVDPGGGPLAVTAGDAGWLGLDRDGSVTLPGVAGILEVALGPVVADFDYYDLPPYWQPVANLVSSSDDILNPRPLPALLTDTDTALDLLGALDHGIQPPDGVTVADTGPSGEETIVVSTWEVPPGELPTLEDARRVTPWLRALQGRVLDNTTPLGEALAELSVRSWNSGGPVTGGQLLPAVEHVEASLAVLSRPVHGLGLAGQLLALGVVAVAATRAHAGRLSRARLFAVRGVSAPALARLAGLRAVPVVLLGIALGWGLATAIPPLLGLADGVGDDVTRALLQQAPLAALAAVAVVALTVGITAAVRARPQAGDGRVPPVAEVLSVVLVVAAWWGRGPDGPVLLRGDGTAEVDVVAFALPLLLVVAVAAVGARLLRLTLTRLTGLADRSARSWRWRGGPFLAFRRLRRLTGVATTLVFVTAAGIGTLVVGATLAASSEATVVEKAGTLVGADAMVEIPRGSLQTEAMERYDALPVPASLVRRIGDGLLDERREVDVLAVDPAEFAEVAFAPGNLGAVGLETLMADLRPPEGEAVDVIAVGDGVRDGAILRLPGLELAVRVRHRVPSFPGLTGERTGLVVSGGGLLDPDDVVMRARLLPVTRTELWIDRGEGTTTELRGHLADVGVHEGVAQFAEDLHDGPAVTPVRSTFGFARGQAVVIAVLGLVALLAHHLAVSRDRALAAALVRRMGLRRRAWAVADTVELTVLVGSACVLGVASGLVAAAVVVADYDPLPAVPLPLVFRMPLGLVWPILAVAGCAVAVAVWLARRVVRDADIATMLREAA